MKGCFGCETVLRAVNLKKYEELHKMCNLGCNEHFFYIIWVKLITNHTEVVKIQLQKCTETDELKEHIIENSVLDSRESTVHKDQSLQENCDVNVENNKDCLYFSEFTQSMRKIQQIGS